MRALGIEDKRIVLPAGRYHQTERNLRNNNRVQVMVASKKVQGSRTPGQGYVISGTASGGRRRRGLRPGEGAVCVGAGRAGDRRRGGQGAVVVRRRGGRGATRCIEACRRTRAMPTHPLPLQNA
ncbi:MAG: pyridoxamine 5'-phosphate oxidase family protein [Burkholderiaceae bacterium]|nr:pyridoxamine 5'-phosphate oxidase family protein [Burkholderiaceae bacterium]